MKTSTLRQRVTISAPPEEVYDALMTSRGHSAFTGATARISPKVGGSFSAWDGYIHGKNLRLVRGRTIVQAWRPTEPGWPKDYYSEVRIELAKVRTGTRLTFTQTGVLPQHAAELARGWKEFYWAPLREYLAGKQ